MSDSAEDRAHVLIVEDSELVTSALRILFENTNRRVSIAGSIAESIAVAQRDPAALVLLDLTLPDGSGLDVVGTLKAAGCTTVVALTGHDDRDTRAKCLAAGCTDVLVKPVPARMLIARVAEWLDR